MEELVFKTIQAFISMYPKSDGHNVRDLSFEIESWTPDVMWVTFASNSILRRPVGFKNRVWSEVDALLNGTCVVNIVGYMERNELRCVEYAAPGSNLPEPNKIITCEIHYLRK